MTDAALLPAFRTALRIHEIGNQTPYRLSFAGKGKSGASFGFMQGDLAAGQAIVTQTFRKALATSFDTERIGQLVARLSVHLNNNPLSAAETAQINAALQARRDLVDAMDLAIMQDVLHGVDLCIEAAAQAHRTIEPKALLYAALWINMSGPPSKLLTWLKGGDPDLDVPVPQAPNPVSAVAMRGYLLATSYYRTNPGNVPHLDEAVAAGTALLP